MGEGQIEEKQSLHVEAVIVEAASVVDRNIHVPQGWWNWRVIANGEVSLNCDSCYPDFNPILSGDYRHVLGTFWLRQFLLVIRNGPSTVRGKVSRPWHCLHCF